MKPVSQERDQREDAEQGAKQRTTYSTTTWTSTSIFAGYEIDEAAMLVSVVTEIVGPAKNADALADEGFTVTERECSNCDHGQLWSHDNEVVCDRCAIVHDEEDRRRRARTISDPWTRFRRTRGNYNSGKKRCVGGYPHPYDWVESSDIDGSVSDVAATEFYR